MPYFDIAIFIIILVLSLLGFMRGFAKEFSSLGSWIFSLWLVFEHHAVVASLFDHYTNSRYISLISACIIIFIISFLFFSILSSRLIEVLVRKKKGGIDRFTGLIFGTAKGIIFVGLLLTIGVNLTLNNTDWWKESNLVTYFKPIVKWINENIDINIVGSVKNKLP